MIKIEVIGKISCRGRRGCQANILLCLLYSDWKNGRNIQHHKRFISQCDRIWPLLSVDNSFIVQAAWSTYSKMQKTYLWLKSKQHSLEWYYCHPKCGASTGLSHSTHLFCYLCDLVKHAHMPKHFTKYTENKSQEWSSSFRKICCSNLTEFHMHTQEI